jgi:hypothetical protein
MSSGTNITFMKKLTAPLLFLFLLISAGHLYAQDVSEYMVRAENDGYRKSLQDALYNADDMEDFPALDCSIEYLRQENGNTIVYRRGPMELHQQAPMRNLAMNNERASQPAAEFELSQKAFFHGGIVLDLPRAGEAASLVAAPEHDMRYMMRVAIVPSSYKNATLTAQVFIERSIVYVHDDTIDIHNSEVFSKSIQLKGNEPLNFALPEWEQIGDDAALAYLPAALEENLLLTMETPHHFGFSQNYPDPFAHKTRISYAVPVEASIKLTVEINGELETLDEGTKQPGVHHVVWDADDAPDGVYMASLSAHHNGQLLHETSLSLHKTARGLDFPVAGRRNILDLLPDRLRISTESGLAYQFPTDSYQSMRNMFTHIGVRIGYQVSNSFEIGVIAGQEAFHEYPSENVDIERIDNYGDVIGYTYGFAGLYVRHFGRMLGMHSISQATIAFTHTAPVADIGYGIRAGLFPQVELFIIPTITAHLKSDVSTKIGLQYGIRARF